MKLKIATSIVLAAFSAAPAFAQHPTPAAKKNTPQTDSTIAALVGTWEGNVYSDHGEMALKMTFTKSPTLGVTVSIMGNGQDFVDAAPTNLKVEGTSASWTVGMMQTACKGTAELIAGTLKGGFDCGGMGVNYVAKKK